MLRQQTHAEPTSIKYEGELFRPLKIGECRRTAAGNSGAGGSEMIDEVIRGETNGLFRM